MSQFPSAIYSLNPHHYRLEHAGSRLDPAGSVGEAGLGYRISPLQLGQKTIRPKDVLVNTTFDCKIEARPSQNKLGNPIELQKHWASHALLAY